MDQDSSINSDVIPDLFLKQVEDALKNLYDLSYLEKHPLAREFPIKQSGEPVGQQLRRELVAAIEALGPGPSVPFRSPQARLHNLLALHYLEQMTIQESANQLNLSARQALRNLREAERELAAVLWSRRLDQSSEEVTAIRLSSLDAEMAHLPSTSRLCDMALLLQQAQKAIGPRMTQRNVTFHEEYPGHPVMLSTNALLGQQLLISLLNHCVGKSRMDSCLAIKLDENTEPVTLLIRCEAEPVEPAAPLSPTITQLAGRLGWTVTQQDLQAGTRQVTCKMAGRCVTVLIIDDNQGLVSLLSRYLTNQACHVITAPNGQEGLRLAKESTPDVILLDIMMEGIQGWEVLQRLHNDPATATIPVIVCSVINEPELARALGARLFLPKPIRQTDVLEALHQLSLT